MDYEKEWPEYYDEPAAQEQIEEITPTASAMYELAERYKALRDEKKKAEDYLKQVTSEKDKAEKQLFELMLQTETENFTRKGTRFSMSVKTRASTKASCKDDLFAALRAHGYGDLVVETVNANSLTSLVKELKEANDQEVPEWIANVVNLYDQSSVSVTKSTRKS
ncbi:MAG: hypothetical protein LUE31_08515 [Lachnospiraceae bacterium]|nr:hypothetical protein [Lachnospiraceae bacterium]